MGRNLNKTAGFPHCLDDGIRAEEKENRLKKLDYYYYY